MDYIQKDKGLELVVNAIDSFGSKMANLLVHPCIDRLCELSSNGLIEKMSVELARFIVRFQLQSFVNKDKEQPSSKTFKNLETICLSAFLAADAIRNSHSCLLLEKEALLEAIEAAGGEVLATAFPILNHIYPIKGSSADEDRVGFHKEGVEKVIQALRNTLLQFRVADIAKCDSPLILDHNRLYLQRYWSYERRLARALVALAGCSPAFFDNQEDTCIQAGLDMANRLFTSARELCPDRQMLAAISSLFSRLVVVSGGPGTGKTRTVTAMMAVLQAARFSVGNPISIAICAPTGKAAARLSQSVALAISEMDIPEYVQQYLPTEASTIHRLLGASSLPGLFHYNSKRFLPYQVVIVDEASMVDLPMMVHLVEALSNECSLVLLGDKDQLASVEAGSVLRDICLGMELMGFSSRFLERLKMPGQCLDVMSRDKVPADDEGEEEIPARQRLRDCLINLTHNYRFKERSGLSELAQAINQGDLQETNRLLSSNDFPDVSFIDAKEVLLEDLIKDLVSFWLLRVVKESDPACALARLNEFKILCAIRYSATGVDNINRIVDWMAMQMVGKVLSGLYKGKAIVVNRNDYNLGLYNGDTGICWPDFQGGMAVWFDVGTERLRKLSPSRLPSFDTAWAMTIHRSQGSEFSKILVVLPPETSAMPGRELLYTAVTRAKEKVFIWGTKEDLAACVERKTIRHSGLGRLLWGECYPTKDKSLLRKK